MVLPGETIATGASPFCDCGLKVKVGVMKSAAGWYIGSWCPRCGPYSRESGYFPNRETAEQVFYRWCSKGYGAA